uniref:Uncharacterized protein n=1 Tax=Populus alba TaxID=43335 RepID=A0A4V6A915_POPAL|nr:hypothetical protein D5086_0000133930 [Populus alba]
MKWAELPDDFEYEVDVKETFAKPEGSGGHIFGLHGLEKGNGIPRPVLIQLAIGLAPTCVLIMVCFVHRLLTTLVSALWRVLILTVLDIAGYLPAELGLLTDVALFHINSKHGFCGNHPQELFPKLTLINEFDVSNNRFVW